MVQSPQGDPSPVWKSKWESSVNWAGKLCHTSDGFPELRGRAAISPVLWSESWLSQGLAFLVDLDIIWKPATFEIWLSFRIEHIRDKLGWFTLLQFKFQLVVKIKCVKLAYTWSLILVTSLSCLSLTRVKKKKTTQTPNTNKKTPTTNNNKNLNSFSKNTQFLRHLTFQTYRYAGCIKVLLGSRREIFSLY